MKNKEEKGTGMMERLMAHIGDRSPEELRKEFKETTKGMGKCNDPNCVKCRIQLTLGRFMELNGMKIT
jgi:hypothetical protein